MANNINWGEIYGNTWWGIGIENTIGWGASHADLASAVGAIIKEMESRATVTESTASAREFLSQLEDLNLLDGAVVVTTPTAYSTGILHSVKPVEVLGAEKVVNGGFDTDTVWTKIGTQSLIENGAAKIISSDGSFQGLKQTLSGISIGDSIDITYTILEVNSGTIKFQFSGGSNIVVDHSVGTHKVSAIVEGTLEFTVVRNSGVTNVLIDDISIKKVTNADFDFTRASSGTRINEQGLVELMGANIPRFTWEGGKPSLLLEPQITNLLLYSEDFSVGNWAKINSSVSIDTETSPIGDQSADLITSLGASGRLVQNQSFTAGKYTLSFFLKNNNSTASLVRIVDGSTYTLSLNWVNGVPVFDTSNGDDYSITEFINGWYKISFTATLISASGSCQFYVDGFNNAGGSCYYWGAQLEALPYATSYIPTAGTTVTRSADVCNNADVSTVVNSVEGVLYAEFYYDANVSSFPGIRMRTLDDQQQVSFYVFNGTLTYYVKSNNVNTVSNTYSVTPKTTYKIAIKYKLNDTVFFVNGTKIATDTVCEMPTSLTDLRFETSGNSMNYRALQIFDRALTDQELIDLTTI